MPQHALFQDEYVCQPALQGHMQQAASEAAAESLRVAAVKATDLLDTERELEFDQIVELAASICDTPICAFSLIDETRQWFKASVGLDIQECDRKQTICDRAIQQPDLFVVEDAGKDVRFCDNPWVQADHGIRFYAGMPLADPDGHMLGTLCVADFVPRQLTSAQTSALLILAAQLRSRLELQFQKRRLAEANAEQERLFVALRASEDRFRTFMDRGPFLGYIKDADGRFIFYNQTFAENFQIDRSAWLGKSVLDLWPGEVASIYSQNDADALEATGTFVVEEEVQDKNGASTFWRSYKFGFWNDDNQRFLGGFALNITEEVMQRRMLEISHARMEHFACLDALTGLANRRVLEERLGQGFEHAKQHGTPLSLILLDIDDFKSHNDEYGHSGGDDVLRQTGQLLLNTVRSSDVAGRYGGEEMLLLLPNTDTQGAMLLAERIQREMHRAEWPHKPVTASFGIASLSTAVRSAPDLVACADEAMYQAKHSGKDCIVTY